MYMGISIQNIHQFANTLEQLNIVGINGNINDAQLHPTTPLQYQQHRSNLTTVRMA